MKFIKISDYYINPDKIAYFFCKERYGYVGLVEVHFVGDDANCIYLDITLEEFIECLKNANKY